MRNSCPIFLVALLHVAIINSACAGGFSRDDVRLLEKFGGLYIPGGEGPLHYWMSVDSVSFDAEKRALTDDDFAAVFPAVRRMDPHRIHFDGRHAVTDKSVALLSQLGSLRVLDLAGTDVTLDGMRRLQIRSLRQLVVAPEAFTESDVEQLNRALPGVRVIRFRGTRPSTTQATERADARVAAFRERYSAAKPGFDRMVVCAAAVDAGVIARGKSCEVVREICGADEWYAAGQIDEHRSRRILYFEPQPSPTTLPTQGEVTASPATVGWYLVIEYWTKFGDIDRYYFSNTHK